LRTTPFLTLLFAATALSACSGDGDKDDGTPSETPEVPATVISGYAEVVYESYAESTRQAETMQAAIDAFVADPTEGNLTAAKNAWKAAREPYLETEVYRFYGGPIDDDATGTEGRINSWPMDEVYVDYVVDDADAGLVNDLGVTIDAATLIQKNQPLDFEGGEAAVSTGWHAIEFLLWGQDLSETGAGERPATDFVDGGTAENQDRRRAYLTVVTQLLVDDLGDLRDAWAEGAPYRTAFEGADPADSLLKIVTGMGSLAGSELSGERMQVAMDTESQEDEHSCFSDNTHRDIVGDAVGIRNVWRNEFNGSTYGTSLRDAVAEHDPDLADALDAALDASISASEAIQPPFDQEIVSANPDGRARVDAAIAALRAETTLVVDVASLYGLTLNLE
jgi:putative iron-regulated protein